MKDVRNVACWGAAGFIGTALLIVAAAPAHSQPPVEVIAHKQAMTRVVHFGDLSLASQKGRNTLYRRVGFAVGEVCPDYAEDGGFYNNEACKDFAWKGARPQIRKALDRAMSGSSLSMTSLTITVGAK